MPVYTSNPRNVIVGGDGGVVVNPGGGTVPAGATRYIPAGGTTGQLLGKESDSDYDVSWQTPAAAGVTSVSATDSTGINFTVTNPTTTPDISLALTSDAVGLGNVDNTSDANKPVSTATQTALNAKQNTLSLTTTGTSGAATLVGATLNVPNYANTNWANTNLTFDANRSHELGSNSLSLVNGASFSEWFLNAVSQVITRYAPSSFRNAQMAVTGDDSDSGTQAKLTATGDSTEAYFLAKGTGSAEIKGLLYLPNYNTSVSGTAARSLALDASGNVITSSVATGDVVGPVGSTSGNIATFNGTDGKTIQDSGKSMAQAGRDFSYPTFRKYQVALGVTDIISEALGLSQNQITTTSSLADARVAYVAAYLNEAATITGVRWWQTVQGDYVADQYNGVGLYTYSGGTLTLVASSTNDGNVWKGAANAFQSKNFATPYPASAGIIFVAFLYNSSSQTTAPGYGCCPAFQNSAIASGNFTNSAKVSGLQTGQASLPASQAMSGITASNIASYLALI